jgi:hypothetical protein
LGASFEVRTNPLHRRIRANRIDANRMVGRRTAEAKWPSSHRAVPGLSPVRAKQRTGCRPLFVPAVFVLVLVAIICLRAYNVGISSFEQFKTMLALVEGVFAVYLGPIIQSLFSAGRQEGEASAAATATATSETTR